MSKNLESIPALIELSTFKQDKPQYKETELELTSFSGGSIRGKSLQLGFVNEYGNNHIIQLSNKDVHNLIQILKEEF